MRKISKTEAAQRLMAACAGLYADLTIDLHTTPNARAYEHHGAVVLKTMIHYSTNNIRPIWYMCDTGNSDLNAAYFALRRKKRSATYCIGPREGDTSLVFSRLSEPYVDPDIRPLNAEDNAVILSILCTPEDDSEEAKGIANIIRNELTAYMADQNRRFLGLFKEATLVGVLVFHNKNNGEVIVINDVFVPREHRGQGHAVRLVRVATAMHPDARYVYSCGSQNLASIATAKKAGYVLAGTCVFS